MGLSNLGLKALVHNFRKIAYDCRHFRDDNSLYRSGSKMPQKCTIVADFVGELQRSVALSPHVQTSPI